MCDKKVSRLIAIQSCYSRIVSKPSSIEVNTIVKVFDLEGLEIKNPDFEFLDYLLCAQKVYYDKSFGMISACMARGWSINRLNVAVLALMVCGVCEILSTDSLNRKFVIAEYVNMSSDFGFEVGFINAVLDKISKIS